MTALRNLMLAAAITAGSGLLSQLEVNALELNGAWATSSDQCTKVFARQGGKLGFAEMSDLYGGGFIVDGNEIVGKFARCRIKARKDSGQNVNLIAACASDIMLSTVQFSLKELDANSLVRLFPGIDEVEIRYHRCPSL
jgi:hypothetical protein